MQLVRIKISCLLLLVLAGCASTGMQDDIIRPEPTLAESPATTGALAELAAEVVERAAADQSGFRLLDSSYDGLLWRLALIDSAVSSIDIMTYLWYPDNSGTLLLERAVLAAQRGVRVRLVVDDLLTIGQDQLFADIQAQPNIELRFVDLHRNLSQRWPFLVSKIDPSAAP